MPLPACGRQESCILALQLSGTSVFSEPLVLALSATHAFYPGQARFDGPCAEKKLTLRWLKLGHKVFNKLC